MGRSCSSHDREKRILGWRCRPESPPAGRSPTEVGASDGPSFRKLVPQLFVFGIGGMIRTKTLERRDDVLLIHIHCAGDHTRGLFEAEASVVVSATHPREDVKSLFFVLH